MLSKNSADKMQFPRELDSRLGRSLSQTDIERFAREDPKIQRHLDVVKRKDLLEHVLKEMEGLRQLENRERSRGFRRGAGEEAQTGKRSWGMFGR